MNRAPAVLWTATGFAAGAAVGTARGFAGTLIPLLILTLPILLWRGPRSRAFALLLAAAAGVLWGAPEHRASEACARSITDGERTRMVGYFTRSSTGKASVFQRLRSRESEGDRCRGSVRVYTRGGAPREARIVVVEGRWIRHLRPDALDLALPFGILGRRGRGRGPDAALRVPWTVRTASAIRARANHALERRLGAQAGVAAALVLADRDGIDPGALGRLFALRHRPPPLDIGISCGGRRRAAEWTSQPDRSSTQHSAPSPWPSASGGTCC